MKKLILIFIFLLTMLFSAIGAELKPYGFIEMYGWLNDSQLLGQELHLVVVNDSLDGSMGMTAKNTRLGLNVSEKISESLTLKGKIEIDFWGDYTGSSIGAEGQSMPRMRHAYVDIAFKNYGFIFGNTWSVVSALLFPSLVNPGAGWSQGKLWQRFPQIQFYYNHALNSGGLLGLKIAAVRATTGSSIYKTQLLSTDVDAGDAAKMPRFESQFFISKNNDFLSYLISVSAVYGKEDYSKAVVSNAPIANGKKIDVSGLCASFSLKLKKQFSLRGEFYQGKNLNAYGNLGSSHNAPDIASIPTTGFWGEAGYLVFPQLEICAGTGQDDPDEEHEDVKGKFNGFYTKNSTMWGAVKWNPYKPLIFQLELMNLKTEKFSQSQKGNIILFSTKYLF